MSETVEGKCPNCGAKLRMKRIVTAPGRVSEAMDKVFVEFDRMMDAVFKPKKEKQ